MTTIRFNPIGQIVLFGGSRLMAELSERFSRQKEFDVVIFSSPRHLEEIVTDDGRTLQAVLRNCGLAFYSSTDINRDEILPKIVAENSLGLALGAAWIFEENVVRMFAKRHLLDFMGIDLPRYRGGAHYTWQILHQNKKGVANLQIIEGGQESFQRGAIIKRFKYNLPPRAQKPVDYFRSMVKKEARFLQEFLTEVKQGQSFHLQELNEIESSYYPFLATLKQGYINWEWSGRDIALFINAFDEPYPGAATHLNGTKVFIKDCTPMPPEEAYHPFTSGLVIRKNADGVFVATVGRLLYIQTVLTDSNRNIIERVKLGDRFWTPQEKIDRAFVFGALYGPGGLESKRAK